MHQPSNHTTGDGAASLLVAALEHTWQTIRTHHPDLPEAVLVVASGADGKRLHLGHFAPTAGRSRAPAQRSAARMAAPNAWGSGSRQSSRRKWTL
jgi:hypothetical protein